LWCQFYHRANCGSCAVHVRCCPGSGVHRVLAVAAQLSIVWHSHTPPLGPAQPTMSLPVVACAPVYAPLCDRHCCSISWARSKVVYRCWGWGPCACAYKVKVPRSFGKCPSMYKLGCLFVSRVSAGSVSRFSYLLTQTLLNVVNVNPLSTGTQADLKQH
jgi:hypothetical protein